MIKFIELSKSRRSIISSNAACKRSLSNKHDADNTYRLLPEIFKSMREVILR